MSMPVIRLRQSVQFPANVYGTNGIDVSKANGNYTVKTDWSDFSPVSASPTSPTNCVLTYDTATNNYALVPSTLIATTSVANAGVRYDVSQSLTATQQTQARQNIYAAPLDALAYSGLQINGAAQVSQELGGPVTGVSSGYACDGWLGSKAGTAVVTFGITGVGVLAGYNSYLYVAVGTAQSSLGSTDGVMVYQPIEGYRIARLGWGTASAQPITIGFWSCHNRPGTYSVAARNAATDRSCAVAYTQNGGTVWEWKTVTIPGDTAGTWASDNTIGLTLMFSVAAGSSMIASAPGVWLAGNFPAVAGQVNGVTLTSDVSRITGVVVIPGIDAPSATRAPFIMRPYDQELITCQRYWRPINTAIGIAYSTTNIQMHITHSNMRASPTVGQNALLTVTDVYTANPIQSASSVSISSNSPESGAYNIGNFTGLTMGRTYFLSVNKIILDARL